MQEKTNNSTGDKPASDKKFSKILSWAGGVIGLLVIVILIGGGAALASGWWKAEWNPFGQKTDKQAPAVYKNIKENVMEFNVKLRGILEK